MQYAILGISSLALMCSAGTLLVMVKTAQELKNTKAEVEAEVQTVKTKTNGAIRHLQATLGELEL